MTAESDVASWGQWVATGLLGLVTVLLGGSFRQMSGRIDQTDQRIDQIEEIRDLHLQRIREERERGDDRLASEVKDLRKDIGEHQNEMHQAQLLITARLAEIPTRGELRLELERLILFQRGRPPQTTDLPGV